MEKDQSTDKENYMPFSMFKDLSEHSKNQIDRAWKAYAILASALGIIISVGLITLYFLYGNSYDSLENKIQERTTIVQEEVQKRIDKEFDSNNITSLIQTAATDAAIKQIDVNKVREIIDNEVQKLIESRVVDLTNQIEVLTKKNEKALDNLLILADLNMALSNAPYQLKYLIKLKELSKINDPKIAFTAQQCLDRTIEEIKRDYERYNTDYWGYKYADDQYFGIKSTKEWKLDDYVKNYNNVASDIKAAYVNKYLVDPKNDEMSKIKFAYSILKEERKPEIVYIICAFVDSKAKLNKDYLFESESYLNWLSSKI